MHRILERLIDRENLNQSESCAVFQQIIDGELDAIWISALLVALKAKGESPEEIAGAARALRESATRFPRPDYAFADSCGTGGDGARTINISTAVSIIAAEMGIPVAKHGNRSVSSACGSADLLEELGVKIDADPVVSRRCLDEVGLCFLYAPQYHAGMRHAVPVRKSLAMRTIFNLIGPLANPTSPRFQLTGVYDPSLLSPMAKTLGLLGCERALVVHGSGLDEIATHGTTAAALYRDGIVEEFEIRPEDAGIDRFPLSALQGGGPQQNAKAVADLLAGRGSQAEIAAVSINTGALAWIFGRAANLKEGTNLARQTIQSGRAAYRLTRWKELSHGA